MPKIRRMQAVSSLDRAYSQTSLARADDKIVPIGLTPSTLFVIASNRSVLMEEIFFIVVTRSSLLRNLNYEERSYEDPIMKKINREKKLLKEAILIQKILVGNFCRRFLQTFILFSW